MSETFKSHSPRRYSRRPEYLKGGDWYREAGLAHHGRSCHRFNELCSRCGEAFGDHDTQDRCPESSS